LPRYEEVSVERLDEGRGAAGIAAEPNEMRWPERNLMAPRGVCCLDQAYRMRVVGVVGG